MKQQRAYLWSLPWIIVTLLAVYFCFIIQLETPFLVDSDGYDYSIMGIHLMRGIGSFWSPEFTATRFTHFYEHPPAGIWYFALFYKLFGTHWIVDKVISFTNALWLSIVVICFWRRDFPKVSRWLTWIPILLLFTNFYINVFMASNKFEDIEAPFTATIIYWFTQCRYKHVSFSKLMLQAIIAGPLCVLGFELNGLLFLYVWTVFIICRLTSAQLSWRQTIYLTITMVASSIIFYLLLIGLVPAARHNNWMYWSTQLEPSLAGKRLDSQSIFTKLGHLIPLFRYFRIIICQVAVATITWVLLEYYAPKKHMLYNNKKMQTPRLHHPLAFYSFLILCSLLPIAASTKFLAYYDLHSDAYVTLFICYFITPIIAHWCTHASWKSRRALLWVGLAIGVMPVHWFLHKKLYGTRPFYLEKKANAAVNTIKNIVPPHSTISVPPHLLTHAITIIEPPLARFMDSGFLPGYDCKYLLTSIYDLIPVPSAYHVVPTNLTQIILYERAHALPSCHPYPETMKEYHHYGHHLIAFL